MNIRSLIIDDDPFIQELLKDKIEQHIPDLKVVDVAGSASEGLEKIKKVKPDLVFLDVEMADMTGFELLSKLDTVDFETIFITSFNHYAIKAIRFNALDYLVKPIDLGELRAAVKRYSESVKAHEPGAHVQNALSNFKMTDAGDEVLLLQQQDGELKLVLKDIVRIDGERNYSFIYKTDGKKILASRTLGNFEEILSDKGFFRCHKSHLINGRHISSTQGKESVTMSDETQLPISRRKADGFKKWFEGLA